MTFSCVFELSLGGNGDRPRVTTKGSRLGGWSGLEFQRACANYCCLFGLCWNDERAKPIRAVGEAEQWKEIARAREDIEVNDVFESDRKSRTS